MLSALFKIKEKPSEKTVELLKKTTLGSNGALYQHLNTEERIKSLDSPLYITLERNEKVLGNVTLCRRSDHCYVRYFAFQSMMQSAGKLRSKSKGNSKVKDELNRFFNNLIEEGFQDKKVKSLYAYVDPKNVKSLWLTEEFGFRTIGQVELRTFSRISPKKTKDIFLSDNWNLVPKFILERMTNKRHFFQDQFAHGDYYLLKNNEGEIICFSKITRADWKIHRLPGKYGAILTKLITFVPGLNKIIRPKRHSFIVPEGVYVKDNCPKLLSTFFNSILADENRNLIMWWVDPKEKIYSEIKKNVRWGLLNKLVGVNNVNVISKHKEKSNQSAKKLFHVSGVDMV